MRCKMRVLLIEDDQAMCRTLQDTLTSEGLVCDVASLGEDGIEISKIYDYDLILLDLILPDINGYEVAKRMRNLRVDTPICIVSALVDIEDKLKGFGFGADDYITKPFNKSELMARIHAIIRRSKGHADSVIKMGRLTVNLKDRCATVDGKIVSLTPKEYSILELMALRRGTTLTKEMFLNHLYGGVDEPELKIVDVFVCKLRRKLAKLTGDENCIQTVWGRGYVLRDLGHETTDIYAENYMSLHDEDEQIASNVLDLETIKKVEPICKL